MASLVDSPLLSTSQTKSKNGKRKRSSSSDSDSESKSKRLKWTKDLHGAFLSAVAKLGIKAVPSAILNEMKVTGLTRENVASHLQKFRIQLNSGKVTFDEVVANTQASSPPLEASFPYPTDFHPTPFEVTFEGEVQRYYSGGEVFLSDYPRVTGPYEFESSYYWPVLQGNTFITVPTHYDQFPDSPDSAASYGSVSPVCVVDATPTVPPCFCAGCQLQMARCY